jgi:hypothetical protein
MGLFSLIEQKGDTDELLSAHRSEESQWSRNYGNIDDRSTPVNVTKFAISSKIQESSKT